MEVPPEVTFRNVDRTSAVEAQIERGITKLEALRDNIVHCKVAVERPHRREASGSPYRVRIDLKIPPGKELVIDERPSQHEHGESLTAIINHAFHVAERQLKKATDLQRNEVKASAQRDQQALVVKIFDEYGFLRTLEGQEVYFHAHSVLHGDFGSLDVGTMVRFEEELGDRGRQATSVQIVGKPAMPPTTNGADRERA